MRRSLFLLCFLTVLILPSSILNAQEAILDVTWFEKDYDEWFSSTGEYFSEGLLAVKSNGKWGFVDNMGKEVVPTKYDAVKDFKEGLASVKSNGNWGFIDKKGQVVIPIKYPDSSNFAIQKPNFSEGLAIVGKQQPNSMLNKYGYIDKTGQVIIPFKYDNGTMFSEGLAAVSLNDKWGFIDKTGKVIIPIKYDYIYSSFADGIALVKSANKFIFIGKTGQTVLKPNSKYDYVSPFSEERAAVRQNGKWGYIDKTGKEVIALKYDDAEPFINGRGVVRNIASVIEADGNIMPVVNYHYQYIDRVGNEMELKLHGYELSSYRYDEFAAVISGGKYGIIDENGNAVVPNIYDDAYSFKEGLAVVRLGKKRGIVKDPNYINIPKTLQTAIPTRTSIKVNTKDYKIPTYNINDENYLRIRDLAYILNKTPKQFNIEFNNDLNVVTLITEDYEDKAEIDSNYHATGMELKELPLENKQAKVSKQKFNLNNTKLNTLAYTIDGNNFIKLRDIGENINFEVAWDASTSTVILDTNK